MSGSVGGIDVGNQTSTIAVARKRGIDVLLNKESNRETPALVSFTTKDRQLGTDAVGSLTVNPKNTISQVKRLIGKRFKSPAVQRDIARFPFKVVEAPDGGCLVDVQYLGESRLFSPVQLMGMILYDLREIAAADGSTITDCVVTVPVYYTESERYAMLAATQIAGLSCLRLMNDNTATALAYGIYKTDLPETDPVTVAFIDMGQASFQVNVVSFKKGQLQAKAHAWDRDLGGRDFDEALFDYWVKKFDEQYKVDIRSSPRASFRLRLACEKLKKVLSANSEATLHVESLINDLDVSGVLNRDQFEELIQPLIGRIKAVLEKVVADAGVTKEALASIEVVGGSSRVPAVIRAIADYFGKEPSRTLNAKECVSRGAALQCAMLSPIFRVRDFEVIDTVALGVAFSWDKEGQPITSVIFERNSPLPSVKLLTFYRSSEFEITGQYTPDSDVPEGEPREIGRWIVGPPKEVPPSGSAKIKVKARLNLHGLVSLESATQVLEEEVEEAQAPDAADAKEKDGDTPMRESEAAAADANMDDAGAAPDAEAAAGTGPSDGGAAAADAAAEAADAAAEGPSGGTDGAAATPMETDAAAQPAAPSSVKKRTKKIPVPVKAETASIPDPVVQEFFEQEAQLALQDRIQRETADSKNALESYVYSLRSKLSDQLSSYAPAATRDALIERLNDMENWLYEDGEDEKKSVYVAKLEELKKEGDAIERRAAEETARGPAAGSLTALAGSYAAAATSDDPKLAHIAPQKKQKVVEESQAALAWLKEKQELQAQLGKHEDPVLVSGDIKKKEDTLRRVADPILSEKAPPPPKKQAPKADEPGKKDAAEHSADDAQANGEETVPSEVEIQEVDGGEAMETA